MLSEETKTRLFKLAFQYRKAKPWEKLMDQQLIGVKLADGQTGYCCIMGASQSYVALGVYIGQPGISSLFDVVRSQMYGPCDEEFAVLLGYGQNCLQCVFDDDDATEEQVEEAEEYAARLGVKLRGSFRYPHFESFVPMERPVPIDDEAAADVLMRGLRATIYVEKALRASTKPGAKPLRVPFVHSPGDRLPLLEESRPGRFTVSVGTAPDYVPPVIPSPDPVDEFTLARLKKCSRDTTWDCTLTFLPGVTIEEDPTCMPATPFVQNKETEEVLPLMNPGHYIRDLNGIYRNFVRCVIENGCRPAKIRVHECDLRGQAFFSVFARQLGIPLTVEEHLPELNDALASFQTADDSDDMMQEAIGYVCQFVREMSFEDMCQLPYKARVLAAGLLEFNHPDITPELQDKVRRAMEYWGMPLS